MATVNVKNSRIPSEARRRRRRRKIMTAESNGNVGFINPTSSSNEDLSDYTDADESISAPTEFLAEFLSAVMCKDYDKALKYCKLILQYEPNNVTAKEFYPLIVEKLQRLKADEDNNSNESDEEENEENTSSSASNTTSESTSEDSSEDQEEEFVMENGDGGRPEKRSKSSSDGDGTTGSYSSLEDDEAEVDQLTALAAKYQIDNMNLGNGNKIFKPLEPKLAGISTNAVENPLPFGTSSDSESPTEPVSQQTIALLRAKVVPN